MARLIIHGGRRISGLFRPAGNKNAALPMLAAAVLTDEEVELANIPLIEDVFCMLDILKSFGARVERRGHTVRICASGITKRNPDSLLCGKVRSSILFAGPMAARRGSVRLYPPGGDVIGRRRLDTHFSGLKALGIDIKVDKSFLFRRKKLFGCRILLDEASVTATENILMAAVLAKGETVIFNAACEPHVKDLGLLLVRMGADISGLGTNRIVVNGVGKLRGARYRVQADHIETCGFAAAAAVTGGTLKIPGVEIENIAPMLGPLKTLGVDIKVQGSVLTVSAGKSGKILNDLGGVVPTISDGIWPSFPSDMMSVAIVAATQVEGTALFFEKMFESRMYFVDRLKEMGARIIQCDPHRVLVIGPSRLRGSGVSSPDIRAGMAVLVAALCADGVSVIENAQVIDRGYEKIEARLRALGAEIRREDR